MPIVNNSLVPYCPALPILGSTLLSVSRGELAPRALGLLDHNPAVVVTGRFQRDWELNSQIYKTRTVKNRLIARLRRQGQTVSYFNIQKAVLSIDHLGNREFNFAPLASKARTLRDADIYVLDEAHLAIPFMGEMGIRMRAREPYANAMTALWNKVAKRLDHGGRLVLISCYHPLDPIFHDSLYNGAMALFFSSPVLELKSS